MRVGKRRMTDLERERRMSNLSEAEVLNQGKWVASSGSDNIAAVVRRATVTTTLQCMTKVRVIKEK
jgi:hypothetical protein